MTSNQINYQKLLEERRHNRNQESETKRANLASEKLKRKDQRVQEAYNAAYFQHNRNVLAENYRHNIATEQKDLLHLTQTLAETSRHNIATEDISRSKMNLDYQLGKSELAIKGQTLTENTRHNLALEGMQSAVNVWNYELGLEKNALTAKSIDNQYNIDSKKLAETQRANVQDTLLESQRNVEQKRHNIVTENLSRQQNQIKGLESLSSEVNSWYRTLSR